MFVSLTLFQISQTNFTKISTINYKITKDMHHYAQSIEKKNGKERFKGFCSSLTHSSVFKCVNIWIIWMYKWMYIYKCWKKTHFSFTPKFSSKWHFCPAKLDYFVFKSTPRQGSFNPQIIYHHFSNDFLRKSTSGKRVVLVQISNLLSDKSKSISKKSGSARNSFYWLIP